MQLGACAFNELENKLLTNIVHEFFVMLDLQFFFLYGRGLFNVVNVFGLGWFRFIVLTQSAVFPFHIFNVDFSERLKVAVLQVQLVANFLGLQKQEIRVLLKFLVDGEDLGRHVDFDGFLNKLLLDLILSIDCLWNHIFLRDLSKLEFLLFLDDAVK